MSVRIHRNLNDHTADKSEGWVITPKGGKSYRVGSACLLIDAVKVSASTLARIRTPKGELTASGARGIGRRTVGAWLLGELMNDEFSATGATIHFNPHLNDEFMIQQGGEFRTFSPGAVLLRFTSAGTVEVVA